MRPDDLSGLREREREGSPIRFRQTLWSAVEESPSDHVDGSLEPPILDRSRQTVRVQHTLHVDHHIVPLLAQRLQQF